MDISLVHLAPYTSGSVIAALWHPVVPHDMGKRDFIAGISMGRATPTCCCLLSPYT